jgi:hypothetical protein
MDLQKRIADFLCREMLHNNRPRLPGLDVPLLAAEGGVVDSFGLQQLIFFLENDIGIAVDVFDIIPDNFQTLRAVSTFAERKLMQMTG